MYSLCVNYQLYTLLLHFLAALHISKDGSIDTSCCFLLFLFILTIWCCCVRVGACVYMRLLLAFRSSFLIIQGGEEDQQLVATFHDGKTVSVPKDKAMWIPRGLYERTAFEIGLPKNVRQEFATQDFYPYYSSCGYPTSGPLAFPVNFDQFIPRGTRCQSPVRWGSSSCAGYPWMVRSKSATMIDVQRHGRRTSDEVIPGTELTKSELNSKVTAQIMLSEMKAADRHDDGRLLKKRGHQPLYRVSLLPLDCSLLKSEQTEQS